MTTSEKPYDSFNDTTEHIARVRYLLDMACGNLYVRANNHDQSKLKSPEKEIFDECTPKLKTLTYGSDEYKASLAAMKPALDHHYAQNSHHPEHFAKWVCSDCGLEHPFDMPAQYPDSEYRWCSKCHPNGYPGYFETAMTKTTGIEGMSLLDLIEMLCDWKAAGERHTDGSIDRSLKLNEGRFKISPQLQSILKNTAVELGWVTVS